MPKRKQKELWVCVHCNKEYESEREAKECEVSHDIVYIGFTRWEIKRFLDYLYTGRRTKESESFIGKVSKKDRLRIEE